MKILVLDNYDSFTYNLVYIIRELGYGDSMDIIRNDKISLEEVEAYDKILLSPGPGLPSEAGIMPELIKKYAPSKDILGVCLGHQAGSNEKVSCSTTSVKGCSALHSLAKCLTEISVIIGDNHWTNNINGLAGLFDGWLN